MPQPKPPKDEWFEPIADLLNMAAEAPQGGPAMSPEAAEIAVAAVIESAEQQGYQIEKKIGAGGVGIVYKAIETSLGRAVALKILRPRPGEDHSASEMIKQEATKVARLRHANIVPIFTVDRSHPPRFLVMELVPGRSLGGKVEDAGPLDPEQAVRIAIGICDALRHAHREGIVHGDVKPSNILLDEDDGRPRLADFGIARSIPGPYPGSSSGGFGPVGTRNFMSPEQEQMRELDERSDVYSLGMTLHFMLTGKLAELADNEQGLAFVLQSNRFLSPSTWNPAISRELDDVVLGMLTRDREDRFQNCEVVGRRLRGLLDAGMLTVRPRRLFSRRRLLGSVAVGLVAGSLIGVPWLATRWGESGDRKQQVTPTAPTPSPFAVKADGPLVSVRDRQGSVIWSVRVKGEGAVARLEELFPGSPPHLVLGVKGHGEDTGKVMVYDPGGDRLWWKPTGDLPYPHGIGGGANQMEIRDLVVADLWQTGEPCIATTSNDLDNAECRVTVFDRNGNRRAVYWHAGQFQRIRAFKTSRGKRMRILAWGYNNDMRGVRPGSSRDSHYWGIACLDPETMRGEAPPRLGRIGEGREAWYGVVLPQGTSIHGVEIRPAKAGEPEGTPGQLIRVAFHKGVILYLNEDGRTVRTEFGDESRGRGETDIRIELVR